MGTSAALQWKTTNSPIKYVRLFKNKELNSGASAIFWANLPDWLEHMYWFYAIPSETQANYPQHVWIDNVKVEVTDHAKFRVGVTVLNGTNAGKCIFDVWAARVWVP